MFPLEAVLYLSLEREFLSTALPGTCGASLMKQEYLQVQWKSGVKQSSGFGACAINTINYIPDKGF